MSRRRKIHSVLPFEADITGLTHDGRGIARVDDKVNFIFGALPSEKVTAKVFRSFSRYNDANTLEVLTKAPERVRPPCSAFGLCGGCQIQHLSSSHQVEHKQAIVRDLLQHQAKVTPLEWLAPLTGANLGYRQKARLGVRYIEKKDTLAVGFREQNCNKIALIDDCQVLDPRVGHHIQDLRQMVSRLEGRKAIAQIEVATTADEVALVFRHLDPLTESDCQILTEFCAKHQFSLYLQPKGHESVHKVWPKDSDILLKYVLKDQNLQFQFHPLDFTQVNQEINQKMINQALALLQVQKTDVVLDLFCGLGNFSLPLAQLAAKVVGVEGTKEMANRAGANAVLNHLDNTEFHAFDLTKDFTTQAWSKTAYDKILIDPPRSGAEEVVKQLSFFKVKSILYVSCNPTTFARDAAILVHQHGFQLSKVGIMDMFPHTAHVETMGLFQRDQ